MPQNDERIVVIILSYVCWGTSRAPPSPNLPRQLVRGPHDRSLEGGGGVEKGLERPPPVAPANFLGSFWEGAGFFWYGSGFFLVRNGGGWKCWVFFWQDWAVYLVNYPAQVVRSESGRPT